LRHRYYTATGEAPSGAAVAAALDHIEAQAQFDGPEHAVHLRVAEQNDRIYLDLTDACWRKIEIPSMAPHQRSAGAVHPHARNAPASGPAAGRLR
jgi:hypothetical protein